MALIKIMKISKFIKIFFPELKISSYQDRILNEIIDMEKRNINLMFMIKNVCPECQFEARNGHSALCSQRGGSRKGDLLHESEIKCPECAKLGRYGTLGKLTEKEIERLKEREGKDTYPTEILGCDECKFWCDADEVKNI